MNDISALENTTLNQGSYGYFMSRKNLHPFKCIGAMSHWLGLQELSMHIYSQFYNLCHQVVYKNQVLRKVTLQGNLIINI